MQGEERRAKEEKAEVLISKMEETLRGTDVRCRANRRKFICIEESKRPKESIKAAHGEERMLQTQRDQGESDENDPVWVLHDGGAMPGGGHHNDSAGQSGDYSLVDGQDRDTENQEDPILPRDRAREHEVSERGQHRLVLQMRRHRTQRNKLRRPPR